MTTIAWDGKRLAGDKRASGEGFQFTVTKVRRTTDGRLIGASGKVSACNAMLDWLDAGASGEPPVKLSSDEWGDLLEIMPDGTVWMWGEYGRFRIQDVIAAIGSGASYALGAMAAGKTADRAVAIAAIFDPQTSGAVDVLPLRAGKR